MLKLINDLRWAMTLQLVVFSMFLLASVVPEPWKAAPLAIGAGFAFWMTRVLEAGRRDSKAIAESLAKIHAVTEQLRKGGTPVHGTIDGVPIEIANAKPGDETLRSAK